MNFAGRRAGNNSEAILQRKDKNFVYRVDVEYDLSQYKQYDTEYKFGRKGFGYQRRWEI